MAAYSAVVSFEQLLNQLLKSNQFPPDCPEESVKSLYENVYSLQSSVEIIFPAPKDKRDPAKELETRIREEIYAAQDAVESSMSKEKISTSIPLDHITTKIVDVVKEAKDLADSIGTKNRKISSSSDDSSKSSFISRSTKIVGQDEAKQRLMEELKNTEDKLQVVPISGMAGIGKTTLARSIYDDEDIRQVFPIRSWVTVSRDYHVGEIYERLLNNMESNSQKAKNNASQGSDEKHLSTQLSQSLFEAKYLIVIDDMWDEKIWDRVKNSLPDDRKGSRIILTTRDTQMVDYAKPSGFRLPMRILTHDESWELLCHKVFGGDHCPPQLEPTGRKISENCRGLPLSLTVVGGLLSQEERTVEFWKGIEEDVISAAAKGEDSYKEILSLSYIHLPGKLKGCFLYMGAFPEDSEIPISKLINLWIAEGFLNAPESLEQDGKKSLENLINRNLVSVRKFGSDNHIKTCGVHDTLRDLAVKESKSEKFFHSIRKYVEKLEDEAKIQRRVSVHKNILMCLEKVYESTKEIELSRSLLYVGPHHHHPLPFSLTFKLLRIFDALTVYFIEFPKEVVELVHLRYLSFTYNGKLPSSISNLHKLQILIVRRQPKIIFVGASFLPNEIWKMSELRHLQFTESDLPDILPGEDLILLANLQSLLNVRATCCTEEVLRNMPHLKKLGMWIEEPCAVPFHLDLLQELESFKFVVLNPIPKKQVDFQPGLVFPKTLKKLTLSGCGLPWEDIEIIRQLPNLEVLKLRELAFCGEEWAVEEGTDFPRLSYLLIEYLDFELWEADHTNFPSLERLIIKHCYNLEKFEYLNIGEIGDLRQIELVDCSPKAVEWAKKFKEEMKNKKDLQVRTYSSWE